MMHVPRPRLPWRPRWFIDNTVLQREGSESQGRRLTYQALELDSNNFLVTLVTSLGFFTGSYVLFTSSSILPMLAFVYWRDATDSSHEISLNNATTAGCIVGMVMFGLLADLFGRRKMYGFELIVLIAGTIGVVMSSTGYVPVEQLGDRNLGTIDYGSFGSMNIQSWLLFWRFLSGVGVGGEYPLSGVIASEFAPTFKRPRILAIVFAMQSFGVAAGAIVSLVVTKVVQARHPYDPSRPEFSARAIDQIWRWSIGLALVPAFFTAIMRFTIPESPRYSLDVLNNYNKAVKEVERFRRPSAVSEVIGDRHLGVHTARDTFTHDDASTIGRTATEDDYMASPAHQGIKEYFWTQGNWRYLLTTALSWFLVDFSLFALTLNNAQTLSKFWYGPTVTVKHPKLWNSNTVDPNASIFSVLIGNSVHLLVIILVPAIVGSVLLIMFITRMNRKLLTWVMFFVTGTLLVITGAVLRTTRGSQTWGINIALYALINLSLEFGVGPLTFILPAELFLTKYRATCHGFSAAIGKLGAVLASVFLRYVTFGSGPDKVTASSSPAVWLGYVLIVFSIPMFLGGALCWWWLPEFQHPDGKSKTLEELAEGWRPKGFDPDEAADPAQR